MSVPIHFVLFRTSPIYNSSPIPPSANGLKWITSWRGDFPPSVFDTSPSFGYRLATQIYLICEVVQMCWPITKSIKNVCSIEDSGTKFIWLVGLLSMLRSIYFDTLIYTTFVCVYRYRRYDRYCFFEPTLRSVFSTWTDITIGVIDFNRRSVLSTCGPITDVTIGILSSWPPFTF